MHHLAVILMAPLVLLLFFPMHGEATEKADNSGIAAEPMLEQHPPQRRRVPALPGGTVASSPTTTQRMAPVPVTPQAAQSAGLAQPDKPQPLTGCDPGGCWDTDANRYHSGGNNPAYLNNAGRLCHRNGAWIQCF